jgi:hypothetical protein
MHSMEDPPWEILNCKIFSTAAFMLPFRLLFALPTATIARGDGLD